MWLLRPVLTSFLTAGIFAYILHPGVAFLARHKVPRGIAAALMLLLLAFLIIFLGILLLIIVQKEGPALQQKIPVLLSNMHQILSAHAARFGIDLNPDFSGLKDFATRQFASSANTLLSAAWQSLRASGNAMMSALSNLVLGPLVLYYLLVEWHRIVAHLRLAVPRRWLEATVRLAREMDQMLAQYLRGQWLVIAVLAVYYTVCLSIAGLNIALPVGIFTGLAVLIPYLGYFIGLTLALTAALLQFSDWYGFGAVAVIYGIGQLLESYFLTPYLVGERIGLHPLAVIFALLAFGQWFGFFGVLLALPAAAIVATALRELKRRYLASAFYQY
ncbi:putative membrane protein [Candidatus Glomeribacter gigasporarum BEG34]|uniref:Putative membrane protein n=1 Tax=Candidatus Glomeribacter gigasporarum BEG34 TaxID=1070319 RepID=G2J9R3_9BURK|nr:putative membrane protein [Candidatus Glomeribacter gigasporarum BEG34]